MTCQNTDESRNPTLDGLRGVAIALVLISHYLVQTATPPAGHSMLNWARTALTFSFGGVELFFVLSGYLIGNILLNRQDAANLMPVFYVRRACRILPIYSLLLISFLIARSSSTLMQFAGGAYFSKAVPVWSYFVFSQNNLMGQVHSIGPWWLVVTWSLAVEEQFYLAAPWLLKYLSPAYLIGVAAASLVICPGLSWMLFHMSNNIVGACYITPTRINSLLIGVALAAFLVRIPNASVLRACKAWLPALLIIGSVAFFTAPFGFAGTTAFVIVWAPTHACLIITR